MRAWRKSLEIGVNFHQKSSPSCPQFPGRGDKPSRFELVRRHGIEPVQSVDWISWSTKATLMWLVDSFQIEQVVWLTLMSKWAHHSYDDILDNKWMRDLGPILFSAVDIFKWTFPPSLPPPPNPTFPLFCPCFLIGAVIQHTSVASSCDSHDSRSQIRWCVALICG